MYQICPNCDTQQDITDRDICTVCAYEWTSEDIHSSTMFPVEREYPEIIKSMKHTQEVHHKLQCGQNLFRKPLIEKMMAEVVNLANTSGAANLPTIKIEYKSPILTPEEKEKAQAYAESAINKNRFRYSMIITTLCAENMRLVKEINEHRAARGIDPLPVFEV